MASIAAQGLFWVVFMCLEALQARGGVELAVHASYLPQGVGAVLKEVASSPSVRPAELARLPVNVVHVQLAKASYGAGFLLLEAGGLEALDGVDMAEDDVAVDAGMRGTG